MYILHYTDRKKQKQKHCESMAESFPSWVIMTNPGATKARQ